MQSFSRDLDEARHRDVVFAADRGGTANDAAEARRSGDPGDAVLEHLIADARAALEGRS